MNSAVFGFSTFTNIACPKIRRSGAASAPPRRPPPSAAACARRGTRGTQRRRSGRCRSRLDAASIAGMPSAAAATCTIVPQWMPATDTRPAERPWSTDRVTMNSTAGPGTTSSAIVASENRNSAWAEGMPSTLASTPFCVLA